MRRASSYFTADDHQRVNDAVAQAERATSAELMVVVAGASGRYDRAEDICGMCLGLIALVIAWLAFQRMSIDWDQPSLRLNLPWIIGIVFGGFVIGAVIAAHVSWIRRLITPRGEMHAEVNARARQAFFDQRIRRTAGRGGVLLYVSLFERMAVVLADEVAAQKLGESGVNQLRDHLTDRLRAKSATGGKGVTDAIGESVRVAGERLAAALPRQPGDVNELPNDLVVID